MRRWPDTLPTPVQDGYRITPAEQAIRTEMEVGNRRLRRISAARRDDVALVLRFSDAEFAAFRAWWGDEPWSLAGGSDSLLGWTLTGLVRAPATVAGPDDVLADVLVETVDAGPHEARRPLAAEAWAAGDRVVVAAALRGLGRSWARVGWTGRDGVDRWARVDLTTWAITTSHPEVAAVSVMRGAAFRRIEVTGPVGSGGATPEATVTAMSGPATLSYTGSGSDAIAVAEVQARRVTGADLWLPAAAGGTALGAAGGTAWFRADLAFGGGLRRVEARPLSPFEAEALPGLGWRVSCTVETRNA